MTPLLAQRSRSDRGFERMYRRHVGDVYRYALAVMRNPADAEDVTQTTFLNAYRAYTEKGKRPEKPQNWLIAIAHNVCRQRFRQSARRPAVPTTRRTFRPCPKTRQPLLWRKKSTEIHDVETNRCADRANNYTRQHQTQRLPEHESEYVRWRTA